MHCCPHVCALRFAFVFVAFDPFMVGRKVPFFVPLQCSLYRGGYIGHFGVNFSKFLFRSLSTRDGFLPFPNDDLAAFTPCACIFALILPFGPFMVGRKVPFLFPSLLHRQYRGEPCRRPWRGPLLRKWVGPLSGAEPPPLAAPAPSGI